jgi:hypothetical protein
MARRSVIAFLVLAVALPAGASGQALPDQAPPESKFLETVSVPAGTKPFIKTKTSFAADSTYEMVADGSVTYTNKFSASKDTPPDSFSADTLYCFEATVHACGNGKPPPTKQPSLGVSDAQTSMFDQLAGKLGQIPYNASHIYHARFNGHGSPIGFYDVQRDGDYVFSGGFTIDVYEVEKGCSSARAVGHAAAINDVRIVGCTGNCEIHRDRTPPDAWVLAAKDTVLKQGDEISCDPDSRATLAFADNSTVDVADTTQLKIASFFTEGGVVRTEILLKMGQVAATVNKSEATKSDFRMRTGEGHSGSVRARSVAALSSMTTSPATSGGTVFYVVYDPGSRQSVWSVTKGVVLVDGGHGKPTPVRAGKEILVARNGKKSAVAPIGKAGARGGVNMPTARALVLTIVAAGNGPCQTSTPRSGATSIRGVKGGWRVTVKLTGKLKGTSRWSVKRGKASPANALARKLARSCA